MPTFLNGMAMTGRDVTQSVGTCHECGKQSFVTRKAARAFMKAKNPTRGDYEYMTVYRCGEYWHYGHTPYEVARGQRQRGI